MDTEATKKLSQDQEFQNDAVSVANKRWRPGSRVAGRYVIIRRLGSGGMGVVAVAEDAFLRKRVAIKALRPDITDPTNIERFRKEVALAHTVTHPNVVRIYDLGEEMGVHFFSMELLEGMPLQDFLRRQKVMPVPEVRKLALKICAALEAAHEAKVVHRDLKPSNIMVTRDDREIVVLDFGISAALDEPEADLPKPPRTIRTGEGQKSDGGDWDVTSLGMGTPKYMSPEQWSRERCGPSSDIYSVGAILFRCLTGRAPFEKDIAEDYAEAHISEEAPRLRSVNPELPRDLDGIVERCLRKRPEDRFQSAAELSKALTRIGAPTRALRAIVRAVVVGLVLAGLGLGVTTIAEKAIIVEMRPAVRRLAELAAQGVLAEDLDQVRNAEDAESAVFERIQQHLSRVHEDNPDIRFIYTLRRTEDALEPIHRMQGTTAWEFVVDDDPWSEDVNGDGVIEGSDEIGSMPGQAYLARGLVRLDQCLATGVATADDGFVTDEFALTLSGYARIGNRDGPGGYVLGVDVDNFRLATFKRVVWLLCLLAWPFLILLPRLAEGMAARRRKAEDADAE